MKRLFAAMIGAGLVLWAAPSAWAQAGDEQEYYLTEEIGGDDERFALGIGFGFVEIGDNLIEVVGDRGSVVVDDDVEPYFALNLRIRLDRLGGGRGGSGFRGYLEPELGYWESSGPGSSVSDLLLGVNLIGGMPLDAVEFFVGAGLGIHLVDRDFRAIGLEFSDSDEALGANAQFGVDVALTRSVSLFGVGRFDIVDDERDELEGKAYVGARFKF